MKFYLDKLETKLKEEGYKTKYIATCKSYAERLLDNNLPVIFDMKHFSLLLGIDNLKLNTFINSLDLYQYHTISIPKKSGGTRRLIVPSENLRILQKWILVNILENIKVSPYAHGFKKNKSIVSNASMHKGKEYLVNIDLKDFFPTIKFNRLFMIFYYYGYTKEMSYNLAKLCTYKGILPQGAPTSPYISNIISLRLDKRISGLSNKIGADYSRYADDITISGNRNILSYIKVYKKIIEDEGFQINESKFRVKRSFERQMVTGLVVNEKISVPREVKDYIKQQIYYCKKYGIEEHLKYSNCLNSNFKEHLYGVAYFIKMVEEEKGLEYLKQLSEIKW